MSENAGWSDYPSTKLGNTRTKINTVVDVPQDGKLKVEGAPEHINIPPGTTDVDYFTICGRFPEELRPTCKSKITTKGQQPINPPLPLKLPPKDNSNTNSGNTNGIEREQKRIDWLSIFFGCSMNAQKWNPVDKDPQVLDQVGNCQGGLGFHLKEWIRLQGSVGVNVMDLYPTSVTDRNVSTTWGLSFSLAAWTKLPIIHPRFAPILGTELQPRILFPAKGENQSMLSLQILAGFNVAIVPQTWELEIFAGGNITLVHPSKVLAEYAEHTPSIGIQTLFRLR